MTGSGDTEGGAGPGSYQTGGEPFDACRVAG
jgi:hypothetical protein